MGRRKQPRCKLCGSDRPLPFGEDTCEVCKQVCSCGRRIPYSGRGRPYSRCPECYELDKAGRVCPCGKPVPAGRRRYCSGRCGVEFRRLRRSGLAPPAVWHPEWGTIEDWEGHHDVAAAKVAAWWRLKKGIDKMESVGDSLWLKGEKVFAVRHTKLKFNKLGEGLPKQVPIDDATRFDALHPEPTSGYFIVNADMTAAVAFSHRKFHLMVKNRTRRWIPRLGSWDDVYWLPREDASPISLYVPLPGS